MKPRLLAVWFVGVAFLTVTPMVAHAQSALSGIARDTTGAVLPGVTVEAASPALIEKVRSAVTDDQGVYRILDLRPGRYNVTFTLPGFATVVREGIDLPAQFTATVNVDMRVGGVEETVTVTGAAPTVDVQNVQSQQVLTQQMLDVLPAARSPQGFAVLTPGVVGQGISGVPSGREELNSATHGSSSNESQYLIDGFNPAFAQSAGGAGGYTYRLSQIFVSEMTVLTSGGMAEQQHAGTVTNTIPKEGGNRFSGTFWTEYSSDALQTDNLTDEYRAQGLTSVSGITDLWDVSAGFGGPVARDKLWFYVSFRDSGVIQTRPGVYENLTPTGWTYTPDLSRPAVIKLTDASKNGRLTWQVTPRNRISLFADVQPHIVWQRNYQFPVSPEATTEAPYLPNAFFVASWRSPVSNRLLVEAGATSFSSDYDFRRHPGRRNGPPAVGFDTIGVIESTTGVVYRASIPVGGGSDYSHNINHVWRYRSAVTFSTGSSTTKLGAEAFHGDQRVLSTINGDVHYTFRNGSPLSITQYATPVEHISNVNADVGVYAQEQWTIGRGTINAGIRYDYYNGGADAVELPPTRFLPARSFPKVTGTPEFHDISPRMGFAYDVFGNGKTAVKAVFGRFVNTAGTSLARSVNPALRAVSSVTRTWTDANGDFIPGCDLRDPLLNGECGQINNLLFGQPNPNATVIADELLHGWGARGYNWEGSAVIQHELAPRTSLTFGYYRRWYGNFSVIDNVLVTPADQDPYCITAPMDSRLPDGGGYQICGLYDVKPSLFGRVLSHQVPSDKFGKMFQHYNGFDLTGNARFTNGAFLSGGMNIGRFETSRCFVIDSPEELRFCDNKPPFQPNLTFYGSYPLPLGVVVSAVYRNLPGNLAGGSSANRGSGVLATYVATNAQIAPSLGRNLAQGPNGTKNVELIEPSTMFLDRPQQLDFRVSKRFEIRGTRLMASMDVFNLFNMSGVNDINFQYGPNWLRPLIIQPARYIKFGGQFDF